MHNFNTKQRTNAPFIVALAVALLVCLPLFGLVTGLFNPPQHPLTPSNLFWTDLWRQSHVWLLLGSTFSLAISVSFISLVLGTWLAWLEQRGQYPGARLLGLLALLPLAMPSYILAGALRESLGPGGWLGKTLGLPLFTGFIPTLLVLVLVTVPFVQLLVSSALARISVSEEEAARSLGANSWQVFYRIILPRLRPSFAFSILIIQLYVISDFGAVAVLDYPVLTWRLYQYVDHQQLAQATVLGFALLLLVIPLLLCARWLHGHVNTVVIGQVRLAQHQRLFGLKKGLAYLSQFFVVGFGVILPIMTLGDWVLKGWMEGITFAPLWMPLRDSLVVSLLSASVIIFLAIWPAWWVARQGGRRGWFIEQATYLTSALPGVLLAFGLMLLALFFSRLLGKDGQLYQWLLGSGILLILGYTMRFLAEAYAGLKTAVLFLDPRLKDCARSLGATPWQWFEKIAVPTIMPGVTVAFVLVVLAVIKELPVTLLLGAAMGIRTLSFRVFDRYQEAFLHDAGLAGLVLLAISLSIVFLTLRWRYYV